MLEVSSFKKVEERTVEILHSLLLKSKLKLNDILIILKITFSSLHTLLMILFGGFVGNRFNFLIVEYRLSKTGIRPGEKRDGDLMKLCLESRVQKIRFLSYKEIFYSLKRFPFYNSMDYIQILLNDSSL